MVLTDGRKLFFVVRMKNTIHRATCRNSAGVLMGKSVQSALIFVRHG